MDYYTVTISSTDYDDVAYEVPAESEDEACRSAVSDFFLDFPRARQVRVISCYRYSPQGSGYTSYASTASRFNPDAVTSRYSTYASVAAARASEATPDSTYTPYGTVSTSSAVEEAGFSTDLPAAPVPETSYHQTLDNGYAPYRSFRVKLIR